MNGRYLNNRRMMSYQIGIRKLIEKKRYEQNVL